MISISSNFEGDITTKFTAMYALVIMALAIIMACYGLALFFMRNNKIRQMSPDTSQEKVGPIFIGAVASLTVILLIILSLYHLVDDLKNNTI